MPKKQKGYRKREGAGGGGRQGMRHLRQTSLVGAHSARAEAGAARREGCVRRLCGRTANGRRLGGPSKSHLLHCNTSQCRCTPHLSPPEPLPAALSAQSRGLTRVRVSAHARVQTPPQSPGHQTAHTQTHRLHSFHKHHPLPTTGPTGQSNAQKGLLSALHATTSTEDPGPQTPCGTKAGVSKGLHRSLSSVNRERQEISSHRFMFKTR